ncbi:basic amino acid ABC transporter substrate-binding protein [Candidatus Sumerlaeota bacterium]|nr:basic amino acid ABC transporter substrate-binding protein [Candidatus Sumerlaeota bacterium]
MKKALLSFLLLLGTLATGCDKPQDDTPPALAQEKTAGNAVIFAINPDYPPMEQVDPKTGEIVGFTPELLKAIGEKGGFTPKLKNVDWKAIFGALETGEVDAIISSVTITEERRQKYDFSDSYYSISQRLVIRKGDADFIKGIDDLKGKKVGVQIGTTGALLMEKQYPTIERATYDSPIPGMADLIEKKISAFMVDEPVALQYSKQKPDSKDQLLVLDARFSEEHYGIVVRKTDHELLDKINKGVRAVKEAGIDQELRKKWLL